MPVSDFMSCEHHNHVPLERSLIEYYLGDTAAIFGQLVIYDSIPSTNDWALQCIKDSVILPAVCLAEHQQQGRGRRGRVWLSPRSCNIYMSLAWSFNRSLNELGPLSLIAGVAVGRTLHRYGVDAQLKWPNDIMVGERKIAGILIESSGSHQHRADLAIGLGLNFDMAGNDTSGIAQPWTDFVAEYSGRRVIDRNRLVADVLKHLVDAFEQFAARGFGPFQRDWDELDLCRGRQVELNADNRIFLGEARGVNEQGALRVLIDGRVQDFHSGDISLRVKI